MNGYEKLPDPGYEKLPEPALNSFDDADVPICGSTWEFVRAESMDVCNDPRFFSKSVMDKRLGAFKSLTLVSSLMFGTALGQVFKLKKDMDFSKYDPLVGYIAIWQTLSFFIAISVSAMCLLSLYVIAHQLFFTVRLMTSGPTGFEQASVFYLTRVIVMWRHVAIKCLFNGLWIFILQIGIELFVRFYEDAVKQGTKLHKMWVANIVNGNSTQVANVHMEPKHKLDMLVHTVFGYIVLALLLGFAIMLYVVRHQHTVVFQSNYKTVKVMTKPIENSLRQMANRGNEIIET